MKQLVIEPCLDSSNGYGDGYGMHMPNDACACVLHDDALIYATGEVVKDKFSGGHKIIVDRIQSFYELRRDTLQKIEVVVYSGNDSWVESLRDRVSNFKNGATSIQIKYHNGSSSVSLEPDKTWRVDPRDELIDGLMNDFGPSNVSFEFS